MKNLTKLNQEQRSYFLSGATRSLEFRLRQLKRLEDEILANEESILEALKADLGKPAQEALVSEIGVTIEEIRIARKSLASWMKAKAVKTPLHLQPGRSEIRREPLGTVLIIAPWNYPFQLAMGPLVAAIAAGNCAVVKPSELSVNTSKLINRLLSKAFSENYVAVVEGGVEETTALLSLKLDHIFFTGSPAVGRIVMKAAAQNLTPVTLELGGKSPAIVSAHADLDIAARRIVWGKFMNAGQTCVAPDFVYVEESVAEPFVARLRSTLAQFFGTDPRLSESYGRIINERNFDRLMNLIDQKTVAIGGEHERDSLFIAPTVLVGATWEDRVMSEEIFGPVLPVLKFKSLEAVLKELQTRDKPLAAYFFSESSDEQELFLDKISFGGGCVNDTVVHLANPHLPFGGVGVSGMGSYHGETGFRAFTHEKSVLRRSRRFDFRFRYPPYRKSNMRWLRLMLGLRS